MRRYLSGSLRSVYQSFAATADLSAIEQDIEPNEKVTIHYRPLCHKPCHSRDKTVTDSSGEQGNLSIPGADKSAMGTMNRPLQRFHTSCDLVICRYVSEAE